MNSSDNSKLVLADLNVRGEVDHNPMNIEYEEKNSWVGQIGFVELVTRWGKKFFCKFDTLYAGLRAGAIIIFNYQKKHGIQTIQQFADRWLMLQQDATPTDYGNDLAFQLMSRASDDFDFRGRGEDFLLAVIQNERGHAAKDSIPRDVLARAVADALSYTA